MTADETTVRAERVSANKKGDFDARVCLPCARDDRVAKN